ncbi:hypothetical protein [Natrinema versiforme]|uniref:Uncharacterized protein n=1 Tax=Natrinema versiforme TaxID=88724 RepID=A0A4P8WP26_9EURY|nr:hypothetical protein [Natrinema versiforme]QCS44213.1 hypothetical protein FEJ81_18420 [Natrinema versiforme]
MRRLLAIGFAVLEIVAPRPIIEMGERIAFTDSDAGRLRPWTVPMARLEGVAFVWLLSRDDGVPARIETALAVVGFVLALVPRTVVERSLEVTYENADELELKRWVVPATRLLGAMYVIAGLFARPVGTPADEATRRDDRV